MNEIIHETTHLTRRRPMLKQLLGLLSLILMLFWVAPVQATMFWSDNFENHLYPNWYANCLTAQNPDGQACGYPQLSTAISHSATHSLWSHYTDVNIQAGTYISRDHAPSTDIWMRFWYYTQNFTYANGVAAYTKHFYNKGPNLDVIWTNKDGSNQMSVSVITGSYSVPCPGQGGALSGGDCVLPPNTSTPVGFVDNTWYCIETHAGGGTAGNADGVIELFVTANGVTKQTLNYRNVVVTAAGQNYFNSMEHYAQNGLGDRNIDDLQIGSTRADAGGCGGPAPLSMSPSAEPSGTVGTAYSGTNVTASGGTSPYAYAATGLPAGVSMSSGGVFSGTPTAANTYSVVVTATDSATPANTGTITLPIVIAPGSLTISPSTLPSGIVGTAYSQAITVSGGTSPYTCSVSAGVLPAGLSLSSCTISGTPTASGTFSVTIGAVDSAATPVHGSQIYSLLPINASTTSVGQITSTLNWTLPSGDNQTGIEIRYYTNTNAVNVAGTTGPSATSYSHSIPSNGVYQVCYYVAPFRDNANGARLYIKPAFGPICKQVDSAVPLAPLSATVQ